MAMKRVMRLASAGCVSLSLLTATGAAFAGKPTVEKVGLYDLYSRYVANGKSVDSLPEYGDDKKILVSGVVMEHVNGLTGSSMLVAGEPSKSDDGFARLNAYDDAEAKKMNALPVGQRFTAICSLDMTMNADFIALSDCVFK